MNGPWSIQSNFHFQPIGGAGSSTTIHENIPQLRQDILALEELSRQLFMEINEMQTMRERIDWSKTFQVTRQRFTFQIFLIKNAWIIWNRVFSAIFMSNGHPMYYAFSQILSFSTKKLFSNWHFNFLRFIWGWIYFFYWENLRYFIDLNWKNAWCIFLFNKQWCLASYNRSHKQLNEYLAQFSNLWWIPNSVCIIGFGPQEDDSNDTPQPVCEF